jgi:hypothetical protein
MTRDNRKAALRAWLQECGEQYSPQDICKDESSPFHYRTGDREYLVLTDREARKECASYIRETLWAFKPDFLAEQTGLDRLIFEALSSKFESANDTIYQLITKTCGFKHFVEAAVEAEGRGLFLVHYYGLEGESGRYFIYRIA